MVNSNLLLLLKEEHEIDMQGIMFSSKIWTHTMSGNTFILYLRDMILIICMIKNGHMPRHLMKPTDKIISHNFNIRFKKSSCWNCLLWQSPITCQVVSVSTAHHVIAHIEYTRNPKLSTLANKTRPHKVTPFPAFLHALKYWTLSL